MFEIGDVVVHRGTGQRMTVGLVEGDRVGCKWFDPLEECRHQTFAASDLVARASGVEGDAVQIAPVDVKVLNVKSGDAVIFLFHERTPRKVMLAWRQGLELWKEQNGHNVRCFIDLSDRLMDVQTIRVEDAEARLVADPASETPCS